MATDQFGKNPPNLTKNPRIWKKSNILLSADRDRQFRSFSCHRKHASTTIYATISLSAIGSKCQSLAEVGNQTFLAFSHNCAKKRLAKIEARQRKNRKKYANRKKRELSSFMKMQFLTITSAGFRFNSDGLSMTGRGRNIMQTIYLSSEVFIWKIFCVTKFCW